MALVAGPTRDDVAEVLQLRGAVQRVRDRCQHRQQFVEILATSRSSPAAVPDDDRVLAVPRRPPLVLALVCALTEFRLATPTRTARGAPPRAPHTSPVPGHRRAAAGRDLTRQEMIHILTEAGCSPTSAGGRRGPLPSLVTHTGPDRYRLIGQSVDGTSEPVPP